MPVRIVALLRLSLKRGSPGFNKLLMRNFRMLGYRKSGTDDLFYIADIPALVRRGKRNRMPLLSGPGSAADTVHIILRVLRKVEIHHQLYPGHVNTPGSKDKPRR